MLAILEFSQPPNPVFASMYALYSSKVLPAVGSLVSGSKDAYKYLPESVRKFPGPERLAEKMRETGFRDVSFRRLTMGITALHLGHA
jgi:demethylmenaquinone methyltransferase/2-methoxy-6-polyprenyl-1,4-benzoquinol methylase